MHKIINCWGHEKFIKIEWNLGKRCNYDCSYCPSIIHDNHSSHTDINTLKSTIDRLVTLPKPIRLSFTGGEPTVHPQFEELINYCRSKKIEFISVTTNATRTIDFYKNLNVSQIVFSLHFEYDWRRCLDTITKLGKDRSLVHVMAVHNKMDDVRYAVDLLGLFDINYAVRRVRWTENENHDIFDDLKYDRKDLDWIIEHTATVKPNCVIHIDGSTKEYHANDIIKLHLNQYKGWSCNAGIESLMINWDGEVHRATCRVGGSLGNIYNGEFTIPRLPVICTRDWCTCAADIPLTKFKF